MGIVCILEREGGIMRLLGGPVDPEFYLSFDECLFPATLSCEILRDAPNGMCRSDTFHAILSYIPGQVESNLWQGAFHES